MRIRRGEYDQNTKRGDSPIARDTASIQRAYEQLRSENVARDKALTDLSEIVREYGLSPINRRPQLVLREDVMDRDGNLRGADIGITWEGNDTFLHGVRVVGPDPSRRPGMRPAMSTPHQPIERRDRDDSPSTVHQQTRPVMSTPYRPTGPGPWNLIGSTAGTRDDHGDPGGG